MGSQRRVSSAMWRGGITRTLVGGLCLAFLVGCSNGGLLRAPDGSVVLPKSESKYWNQLSDKERKGALNLGYDEEMWNKNKVPKSDDKRWSVLTSKERKGAQALGYGHSKWNEELDKRSKLPPGGQKTEDLLKAADKITTDIESHLTDKKASDNPDSPEAHDKQMEAEMHSKAKDPDSPEAHDENMQAEISAHISKKDETVDPDAPPPESPDSPESHDARMQAEVDAQGKMEQNPTDDDDEDEPDAMSLSDTHPEASAILQKAEALTNSVPIDSKSYVRAQEVYGEIKATAQAAVANKKKDESEVPNHYKTKPEITQPGGVPMPEERLAPDLVEKSSDASSTSQADSKLSHKQVEANNDELLNAASSLQQKMDTYTNDKEDPARKITQDTDDRQPLLDGNKKMIGKINNFFGDTSQQEKARAAAPGIVNAGLSAVHPNSQNDAGVAAQESMKNRNSGGFFSRAPQEAGDPTMTQG